jgi:hypothetical protein
MDNNQGSTANLVEKEIIRLILLFPVNIRDLINSFEYYVPTGHLI